MTIGERLKIVRGNLSQNKISKRLNVSMGALQTYEYGKRTPDATFIATLCREFDINANWLLTGEGPMRLGEVAPVPVPAIGSPVTNNVPLGIERAVALLAQIFTSGEQVFVRAITANLEAFSEAIDNSRRAIDAERRMAQMEKRLAALESRLAVAEAEVKAARAAPDQIPEGKGQEMMKTAAG